MTIAFLVNDIATEGATYTTTALGYALHGRGHEVYLVNVGDLSYTTDDRVGCHAVRVPAGELADTQAYTDAVQAGDAERTFLTTEHLDVLFLRNNPSDEVGKRDWAVNAGIVFGQLAARQGVLVVNDPFTLANALNKMYFQQFPEAVRPRSIISRNVEDIRAFCDAQPEAAILKPLQGSGGKDVFIIRRDDHPNLNQITEALARDGYVVAQEYLPAAKAGDTRLFVMNGQALQVDGVYCAIQRVNAEGDIRSNIHAGGTAALPEITPAMLQLVELVRPKLVRDGLFLVGLDIVGDKLLEINVLSPGAVYEAGEMTGVDFAGVIAEALERKVAYRHSYPHELSNAEVATL